MIKIRALRPSELRQVLTLLNRYSDRESEYSLLKTMQQLYIPMHRVSQLLPLNLQFMPAIFVAVAEDKVLGMIWLSRDGSHSRRWKIDHLILDPDSFSYDVGTQLVNYVINRYGGDGVQTFLAYVDQHYETGLALLKSCGFRRSARQHYFVHRNPANLKLPPVTLDGLRDSHNGDCAKLATLYNDCLPVDARVGLSKGWRDFYRPMPLRLIEKTRGAFNRRWVFQDLARDCFIGSVELVTRDYKDFTLHILASPGWQSAYRDLVTYAVQQVLLTTTGATLYVECFEFCKAGLETLEQLGFQRLGIAEVLLKDYWIPVEDKGSRLQSPILLFSGRPTPAMNCRIWESAGQPPEALGGWLD
ncbi:GNAT family N-acetyltransferase [Vampirovibrio chlorellavorus]|uniref:GNAT family N-acetyltransferase n=1 Tax=Vampirovibrio chlorellavorus TaxID=758823 RepID=UPI0026F160EE|nr:GNAT family N-acetyltransferase [Vampirovibrio chlorellavorus]